MAPLPILSPAGDVAVQAVDDGALLVDMRSGLCFELNRVGYEVWLLIQEGKSEAAICQTLSELYGMQNAEVALDVQRLLRALTDHSLIRTVAVST